MLLLATPPSAARPAAFQGGGATSSPPQVLLFIHRHILNILQVQIEMRSERLEIRPSVILICFRRNVNVKFDILRTKLK